MLSTCSIHETDSLRDMSRFQPDVKYTKAACICQHSMLDHHYITQTEQNSIIDKMKHLFIFVAVHFVFVYYFFILS